MSRKKEQLLWDRMHSNLRNRKLLLQRVENMAGVGDPDVRVLRKGRVTYCELKVASRLPVREATPLLGDEGLSVEQRNWHLEWIAHGGRSMIIVGVRGTAMHWALWGNRAEAVNRMTVAELSRYACVMGVMLGDGFWHRLEEAL